MTGSEIRLPPKATWRKLLDLAFGALATLPQEIIWSWGGGTALALALDHRSSDDIDIFFTDARALTLLSPQRNGNVRAITDTWQEPGHYIKLERKEGEIDFIVSQTLTDPPTHPINIDGRPVALEYPAEILAKKMHHRGSRAVARDVFDLAATRLLDASSFSAAVTAAPEGARRMADEIRRKKARLDRELPGAVRPTRSGEAVLDADLLELAADLDRLAGTADAS